MIFFFFFFFQAEDGIRDKLVTGVQTCALPISRHPVYVADEPLPAQSDDHTDGWDARRLCSGECHRREVLYGRRRDGRRDGSRRGDGREDVKSESTATTKPPGGVLPSGGLCFQRSQ